MCLTIKSDTLDGRGERFRCRFRRELLFKIKEKSPNANCVQTQSGGGRWIRFFCGKSRSRGKQSTGLFSYSAPIESICKKNNVNPQKAY